MGWSLYGDSISWEALEAYKKALEIKAENKRKERKKEASIIKKGLLLILSIHQYINSIKY